MMIEREAFVTDGLDVCCKSLFLFGGTVAVILLTDSESIKKKGENS